MNKYSAGWWLVILVLFTAAGLVYADTPEPDAIPVPVNIDEAQVRLSDEGIPELVVEGSMGTGCDLPAYVDQEKIGSTLSVEIYQAIPPDVVCAAMLVPYSDTIPLDLAEDEHLFEVVVNGVEAIIEESVFEEFGLPGDSQTLELESVSNRVMHVIEEVTLQRTPPGEEGSAWTLIVEGYQPDRCDFPVIVGQEEVEERWLVVEIYREIPSDVRCAAAEISFMQTIDLEGMTLNSEFSQFSWVFEVNDFIGVLPNFRVDPNRGIFAPIPPVEREALVIENVRVREATTDHIRLELSGFHPNGCRVPVRVRTEWIEETLVVDVYRPGALEGRMCPAILLMYNETVTIEGDFEEGVYSYDVNGETGVFTIDGSQAMRQVPHVIEDVQVQVLESSPPQISLVVSGHIPDGCEAETQIDRRQEDNTVFVEIYRELPPFVDCPAVVQDYEDTISLGAFQPGTYTFDVNGVVVTAEI